VQFVNASLQRRRRAGIAVLVLAAALVAGAKSWSWNSGLPDRVASNSAIIRVGADTSAYVSAADSSGYSVPVRNDSPYPITVVSLKVPAAGNIVWDGRHTVIQAGQTEYLTVLRPRGCSTSVPPQAAPSPAYVTMRVTTRDGKPHGNLRVGIGGALAYAVKECGTPAATPTAP
jgi:hypothetical protein